MSDPYQPAYLDSGEAAERFLKGLGEIQAIAVDTEGASFHRFVDRIYLLQLSTRNHSAIIDPLHVGDLPSLGDIMQSPSVEKVFHDADYDLRLLRQDYGWQVKNVFDTRISAQLLGITSFGLAALLERFFSVKLDKKHQRADWSRRPLTPDMLDYAAQDTRYLLDLRDELYTGLLEKNRVSWAKEEFARLESIRFAPDDSANAFLRIKGARDLDRRGLALLRELVAWRDGVARALDRSTFRVMGNDTLLDISRRSPKTIAALGAMKGVSGAVMDRYARDVLDAVERGLAVPDAELPKFPRAPRWERDPEFDGHVTKLRAVRDAAAKRLALDPGVLCGRERLETIARRKPVSVEDLHDVADLRQWQIDVLGEDFIKVFRR